MDYNCSCYRSIKQEYLSQEILDLLTYAFETVSVQGLPLTAVEISITENDPDKLVNGGCDIKLHSGIKDIDNYKLKDSPDFALIFDTDVQGNFERGKKLYRYYLKED